MGGRSNRWRRDPAAVPAVTSDPHAPWSITFSTLESSGLDGFYFLADGQEIDLGTAGFNFTLGIPPNPDFNFDGTVDAADYVAWRKTEINGPTSYDTWRSHFGQPAGSGVGANAAIPEPASLVLLMFAAAGSCLRQRLVA